MKRWQCKDIPDALAIQAAVDSHYEPLSSATMARNRWRTIDIIIERTGAPYNVAHAKLQRLNDRGLVDYGVSLRTCWATDKGRALLETAPPTPPAAT